MNKLKFILPLLAVASLVAGLAAPAGAATTGFKSYRDINSPPNSCAFTTGDGWNVYHSSDGTFAQQAIAEADWFVNDSGCTFGGGPHASLSAGVMRVRFTLECTTNGGSTHYVGYDSGTYYNAGGTGQAAPPPSGNLDYCGSSYPLTQIRVTTYGGYFVFGAWFNTQHSTAWLSAV